MTARPNPASPRAGVMRLSLLTHRTNRATANCLSANLLWVTQTSHDLHPENRGQAETQSRYPRSPPHRPSGTLLRWEAQFRRGTARKDLHRRLKLHCVTHEIAVMHFVVEAIENMWGTSTCRSAWDSDGGNGGSDHRAHGRD